MNCNGMVEQSEPVSNNAKRDTYFDEPSWLYILACERGDFLILILLINPVFCTSASVDQQSSSSESESEFHGSWLELEVTEFMEPDVSVALIVPLFCGNFIFGSKMGLSLFKLESDFS